MNYKRILFFLFLLLPQISNSAPVVFTGDFQGTIQYSNGTSIPSLNGSWSFTIDDSLFPTDATGGTSQIEVDLDSISLSPNPIGSTTFDISNVHARIDFGFDGELTGLVIGGLPGGTSSVLSAADDFLVAYSTFFGNQPVILWWGIASESGFNVADIELNGGLTGSFSISSTTVPLPSAILLFSSSLIGMTLSLRKPKLY